MLRDRLFKLTIYASVFLLLYIIIFAVFVKTPEMLMLPSFAILAATTGALLITLGIFCFLYRKNRYLSKKGFSLVLGLCTFIPRIIWVVFINTAPISDFYEYHNYAVSASKGLFELHSKVYPLFPFKFGYPLVLSVLYRIFGTDIMVAKVFNVVVSLGIAFLIYKLGTLFFNERTGRIAGLIFAFWPAQIMYSSVVAAEHIFMLLFILAIWFFKLAKQELKDYKDYLAIIASGVMIALAYIIRPVSIALLPILVLCLFLFSLDAKSFKELFLSKVKISAIITSSTIVTIAIVTIALGSIIGVRLWKSSSGFSFYIGTNYESSGMYSAKDEEIIQEFDYNFEEVHKQSTKRAIQRIVSKPVNFLRLIEKKFIIQWTNEDYGYYWSMFKIEDENKASDFVLSHPRAFIGLIQIYYIAIIVFSAIGLMYTKRQQNYPVLVFALLFIAFVGAHTLFEVQSRYHFPVIPFLIIIAGYGIERIAGKLLKDKT